MRTKLIEAVHGVRIGGNWGKFLVGTFDTEWRRRSAVDTELTTPLLRLRGWSREHFMVMDIETGEGGLFRHGGFARADLVKTRVWVCPLFEPLLGWLYTQDLTDLEKLPDVVELPDAPFAQYGYRRSGGDYTGVLAVVGRMWKTEP